MTKEEIINRFDINGPASNDSIFGLPFDENQAEVIVLPVPWEVTVSYTAGTAAAPAAIKKASLQVDLFDPYIKDAWKLGIWMAPINAELNRKSGQFRAQAEAYLESFENGKSTDASPLPEINKACLAMVELVKNETLHYLNQGKIVALLGGDHSTPLGYLQALASKYASFGILQIDAHADLRIAYEDFEYSHASVMYNALKIPQVEKLVQVGIRDYCQEEVDVMNAEGKRVKTFFDRDLKHDQFRGKTWKDQVGEIVDELPQNVFLSFDIDGLDPKLCPNTGTPVAGGFETEQVLFLVENVIASRRKLIGFDLNEVGPSDNEWDENVGARLLYRLCNLLGKSNGKI
jgi:agmatinase